MDVSLPIIAELLPEAFHGELHAANRLRKSRIVTAYLGVGSVADQENCLFVADGSDDSDLSRIPASNSILYVGEPVSDPPRYVDHLVVDGSFSIAEALDAVQRIDARVREWKDDLTEAVLGQKSLSVLCKIGYEMLENEFCIQSPDFFVMAFTPHVQDYLDQFVYDSGARSFTNRRETMRRLQQQPAFRALAETKDIAFATIDGFDSITRNFFVDDRFAARLVMPLDKRGLTPGYRQLLNIFFPYLEYALAHYIMSELHVGIRPIRACLAGMLAGDSQSRRFVRSCLSDYGWDMQDRHLVVASHYLQEKSQEPFIEFLQTEAESAFGSGHAVVLLHQGKIAVVFNLSLMDGEPDALPRFFSDNDLASGMSRSFEGIAGLSFAYQQALIALELGMASETANRCFSFDDYAFRYLIDNSTRELPAEQIAPQGIIDLMRYDDENDGCLLETLGAYLDASMNAVHTAEKLGVHRSTLLYRLGKIRSITGCDLQDPEERLYYAWSYALLRNKRK